MSNNFVTAGTPVTSAKSAIIMLHGRGSTAEDIIGLADHFDLKETAIFAPQAARNSWYPNSFIAPVSSNQPDLDQALGQIEDVLANILASGIPENQIYFAGFSQGPCLCLEFVTRNAAQYGGVIAFTGGLIGEKLELSNYKGNFNQTPVLITTGDPDSHVPLTRVNESVKVLESLDAQVTLKVYKGRQHTIQMEEIELAKQLILQ